MKLYRIVKDKARTRDLSGTGAYRFGGRWNSKGTYMLYSSENSSLAWLEMLVHFDKSLMPPRLFMMELEMEDAAPVYVLPAARYPPDWKKPGLKKNQQMGDKWMAEKKYLAIKVRSAVNELEYNYLLNPLFPRFSMLVRIKEIKSLDSDSRLRK